MHRSSTWATTQLAARFDAAHGGFGDAPKFPQPVTFNLLTRVYARHGAGYNRKEKRRWKWTCPRCGTWRPGGIHDHLGGGFHRYSTDARWHVPHFEKMLYDQAQLATAYLEAYQITGDGEFAATARDILTYVHRDLTDPSQWRLPLRRGRRQPAAGRQQGARRGRFLRLDEGRDRRGPRSGGRPGVRGLLWGRERRQRPGGQ